MVSSSLHALEDSRSRMELEMEAIVSELTTSGMGIDTPLVDAEGFPRSDIDLYRARSLRQRLACLKNDWKDVQSQLSQAVLLQGNNNATTTSTTLSTSSSSSTPSLSTTTPAREAEERALRLQAKPKPKFDPQTGKWVVRNWDGSIAGVPEGNQRSFDTLGPLVTTTTTTTNEVTTGVQTLSLTDHTTTTAAAVVPMETTTTATLENAAAATEPTLVNPAAAALPPFARIDSVAPQSPAERAGLCVGDEIVVFGGIVSSTLDWKSPVAQAVTEAAQQRASLTVVVQRNATTKVTLTLTPQPWSGRGLLGCHLVPI